MSKKFKTLKWESVPLDGFPITMDQLQGFVGLEECTDYGLDKESKKKTRKKKQEKKRKGSNDAQLLESIIPHKKQRLSNGFIVESCKIITPSLTNALEQESNRIKKEKTNRTKKAKSKTEKNIEKVNIGAAISMQKAEVAQQADVKKSRRKLGDNLLDTVSNLTPEDMLTWAEFKLPEEILKALAELGFKQPTKIQQLSLPAAIHGRRDILGAAETGSGKTLAFGLPILSGIIKLKEKAQAKCLDVYEIPYKKASVKKKDNKVIKGKPTIEKDKTKKDKVQKFKESSEDGYSSDDEAGKEKTSSTEEEFIEEYEVPIRKRTESVDEGNDSGDDDEENYVHLSDMLDSDDLSNSTDDGSTSGEVQSENDEESTSGDDHSEKEDDINDSNEDIEKTSDNNSEGDDSEEIDEELDGIDEVDTEKKGKKGIGCIKVIDNLELPGHVMTKTGKPLYALILTPTRELAIQISRHLIAVAKYTGLKVATIVGGMAAVKQERVLRCGPEVVVATPGRLWELVMQGQPHLQQLSSVKFLAIDETDRMVERGHFEELTPLLERLNADDARRSTRQNFVFSATLTLVHDLPSHMKGKKVTKRGKILNRKIEKMTPQQKIKKLIDLVGMTEPKVVDITTQNLGTAETLTECRIVCSMDHKDAYLYYVLKMHQGRTIVFCNSIGSVKRLAQIFNILKCRPLPLHASMPQRQRLKNLERFRDDPHGVLIATDVAARGLDIPNVDHVIHYQVPKTAENYVHRSGRTARANKEGLTILMMDSSEAYLYAKLCRTLNKSTELPTFPVPHSSVTTLKDLVSTAREVDALMLKKKRTSQAVGWRERAAREMDIIIDEDDVPMTEVDPSIDKALSAKKKKLDHLLMRPLFPRGFSFKYPTLNDNMSFGVKENALQVMKKAIETGKLKKEKRTGKNESLLKLEKILRNK